MFETVRLIGNDTGDSNEFFIERDGKRNPCNDSLFNYVNKIIVAVIIVMKPIKMYRKQKCYINIGKEKLFVIYLFKMKLADA